MKLGILFPATVIVGCAVPSSTSPQLLAVAEGPGAPMTDHALVGTRFPVLVTSFGLPLGDCGGGPCPPPTEALTAVSAECDGNRCLAVASGGPQGVATFLVTPTSPGTTTLHFQVRTSGGDLVGGSTALTFVSSGHVELHSDPQQESPILDRTKYASLPGNTFNWQMTLDGDDGTRLAADPALLAVTFGGGAFAPGSNTTGDPSYVTLVATKPGTSTLHLAVGAKTRDVSLTVIDPSDVTGVEFRSVTSKTPTQLFDASLESPRSIRDNGRDVPQRALDGRGGHVGPRSSHRVRRACDGRRLGARDRPLRDREEPGRAGCRYRRRDSRRLSGGDEHGDRHRPRDDCRGGRVDTARPGELNSLERVSDGVCDGRCGRQGPSSLKAMQSPLVPVRGDPSISQGPNNDG